MKAKSRSCLTLNMNIDNFDVAMIQDTCFADIHINVHSLLS